MCLCYIENMVEKKGEIVSQQPLPHIKNLILKNNAILNCCYENNIIVSNKHSMIRNCS